MKKQHFPSPTSLSNFVHFSSAFLLFQGVLALEGGALRGCTAPRGGANVFQNSVESIEEVLEVATYGPKHSFIFFKAETKELFSEMFS